MVVGQCTLLLNNKNTFANVSFVELVALLAQKVVSQSPGVGQCLLQWG
jgi:hypothetical protein